MKRFIGRTLGIALSFLCWHLASATSENSSFSIGVAKADITPDYSIRLCGYAVRKKESEGITQRLWAKALAIGPAADKPAILITVDNTGVPAWVRNEVADRLHRRFGIDSAHVTLCSSHTHSAPC